MKNIKKQLDTVKRLAGSLIQQATKHRFTLLFIILGAAIGFALLRTRSFIDIPRDEQRFKDETSKIEYKDIDQSILETFRSAQADQDIDVSSQFEENRNNPFVD